MSRIRNMTQMREHALETLYKLENGQTDIKAALTNVAIYSSVIAAVKTEMDYCRMIDKTPSISFLEDKNVIGASHSTDNARLVTYCSSSDLDNESDE